MPLNVHIPWSTPYAYTEFTYEPDPEHKIDWVALMKAVKAQEDAYREVFGGSPQPAQTPQNRPQQASRPQGGGSGLFCPEHRVEVRKTDPKYDKDGDRYYHPLQPHEHYKLPDGRDVKNHNLYFRQLVDTQGNPPEPLPPQDANEPLPDDFPPF
jgi:hypothetical protein